MSYTPPDIDPNNKILAIVLWLYTMAVGYVTNTYTDPVQITQIHWLDIILEIISKLTPLLSTLFLYIINKKQIDAFFKHKFDWFKSKNSTKQD